MTQPIYLGNKADGAAPEEYLRVLVPGVDFPVDQNGCPSSMPSLREDEICVISSVQCNDQCPVHMLACTDAESLQAVHRAAKDTEAIALTFYAARNFAVREISIPMELLIMGLAEAFEAVYGDQRPS
jgi:hypothetical protein